MVLLIQTCWLGVIMANESGHLYQCSRCNKIFPRDRIVITEKRLYSTIVQEKSCPWCGGKVIYAKDHKFGTPNA